MPQHTNPLHMLTNSVVDVMNKFARSLGNNVTRRLSTLIGCCSFNQTKFLSTTLKFIYDIGSRFDSVTVKFLFKSMTMVAVSVMDFYSNDPRSNPPETFNISS